MSRQAANDRQSQETAVLRVMEIDPGADARWETFAISHPSGSIYHHPLWLRVLEATYHYEPAHLACEDGTGNIRGILPLFRTRGLLTGNYLYSLPRTAVAGPLAADDFAMSALLSEAIERAQSTDSEGLRLKVPSDQIDGVMPSLRCVPAGRTYVLDLPERMEDVRFGSTRNHARIRWAVNKARRAGVRVRLADCESDLQEWYRLYLETMRHHATPPRPYRFFKSCWDLLRPAGMLSLLLAEHNEGLNRALAGSVFLKFGRTVFYAFNGQDRSKVGLRPNDAIQWQSIMDAVQEGFRRYDFGEVAVDNLGLAEFKIKWGAKPTQVLRCSYAFGRKPDTPAHNDLKSVSAVAARMWKHLPLRATALLGDFIFSNL